MFSIVGLLVLFMGVRIIEPEEKSIDEISEDNLGETISVTGEVSSKYYNGDHLFFDLEKSDKKIDVVFFDNIIENKKINPEEIENGDKISVTGKIDTYKGQLEIIGTSVTIY